MQGWMFVHLRQFWTKSTIKAYLKPIANEDLLLLDLIAEKRSVAAATESFFDHPYIWCFLHNFGGDLGMSGNLQDIFSRILGFEDKNLEGLGLSMEGINQNIILYHAVLSLLYNSKKEYTGSLNDMAHIL